jgi:hypothetical protein
LSAHPEFTVVDDSLLIILLYVIGEVVNWDIIVFNVFHDLRVCENIALNYCSHTHALLESLEFAGGQRVGLANDRNDIDTGRQTAHQFDVDFSEAVSYLEGNLERKVYTYAWPVGVIK